MLECVIIISENRDSIISSKLGATGDDDAWLFIPYDDLIFSIIMLINNHTHHNGVAFHRRTHRMLEIVLC